MSKEQTATMVPISAVQARLREMARNLLIQNTAENERSAAFHMSNALNTAAIHLGREYAASPSPAGGVQGVTLGPQDHEAWRARAKHFGAEVNETPFGTVTKFKHLDELISFALSSQAQTTGGVATAWVCKDFTADPCGSARCASCGKRRHEHPAALKSGAPDA